jgi:hypothetical protein
VRGTLFCGSLRKAKANKHATSCMQCALQLSLFCPLHTSTTMHTSSTDLAAALLAAIILLLVMRVLSLPFTCSPWPRWR